MYYTSCIKIDIIVFNFQQAGQVAEVPMDPLQVGLSQLAHPMGPHLHIQQEASVQQALAALTECPVKATEARVRATACLLLLTAQAVDQDGGNRYNQHKIFHNLLLPNHY